MSTSKLQNYLSERLYGNFPFLHILENHRPSWLISSDGKRLELDFFIESLLMAIEVQGQQHYEYIEFFHKYRHKFVERKLLDREKKDLCYGKGISLVEILTEQDADILVGKIQEKLKIVPKYYYSSPVTKEEYKTRSKSASEKRRRKEKAPGEYHEIRNPELNKNKKVDNSEFKREERMNRCTKKLQDFRAGKIDACTASVAHWARIISNNGIEEN
jgi:hypothetical protein